MIDVLLNYGLFLAKTLTIVLALLFVFANLVSLAMKGKAERKDLIQVKNLNEKYAKYARALQRETTPKHLYKRIRKKQKLRLKEEGKKSKQKGDERKKRVFVVSFVGDTQASEMEALEEEINAILTVATSGDEVLVKLESMGGMVHSYGLAASQLARVKNKGIPLTVSVDKVAASGGYMMACVADRIIAAPFAIIGSIGVIAQLPNFNKLLKRHDIEYEQITAGKYKRTLTLLGENSDEDREKVKEDLEETHRLFKDFIVENRADLDIESVATGDVWYGAKAKDLRLIDEVLTGDDYLMNASRQADLYEIKYEMKKPLSKRLPIATRGFLKDLSGGY